LIYGPAALLSPIWRISPLITFALARFTLRGIEIVTFRDGVAAMLIVRAVFGSRPLIILRLLHDHEHPIDSV
jgi:hypothetical protein